MRLFWLHLRSRPMAEAGVGLVAIALTTWLLLETTSNSFVMRLVTVVIPLAAAFVVAWSARSPFGESEGAVGSLVPRLRLGQLGIVLVVGILALSAANETVAERATTGEVLRNVVGYAGLAFLGRRVFGPSGAWALPLAVGFAAFMNEIRHPGNPAWWAWPVYAGGHDGAALASLGLLVVGLIVVAREARPRLLATVTADRS